MEPMYIQFYNNGNDNGNSNRNLVFECVNACMYCMCVDIYRLGIRNLKKVTQTNYSNDYKSEGGGRRKNTDCSKAE